MTVEGRENLSPKNEVVIYISNHESMMDIPAAHYLGRHFAWMSKASIFKTPVLGTLMRLGRCVPIERGSRNSAQSALLLCKYMLLKLKWPVFMFPEGTRSVTGRMKEFKYGAFTLSMETEIPIQPIVMRGTHAIVEKGSLLFNKSNVVLKILPKMTALEGETLIDFVYRVREVMVEHHKES
jgi:1-acyl-sn-glycerol-3-phosphate acyltransferase